MENLPSLGDMPEGPFPCFIDFRVTDQDRFQVLCHTFEILKQEKLQRLEVALGKEDDETENNQEQMLQRLVDTLFDSFD